MPARNPRVNVVLEKPVYDIVGRIARKKVLPCPRSCGIS